MHFGENETAFQEVADSSPAAYLRAMSIWKNLSCARKKTIATAMSSLEPPERAGTPDLSLTIKGLKRK